MHTSQQAWDIAKDEWGMGLADIPTTIIRKTLDELRMSGDEFPPNLPKFIKICHKHFGIPDVEQAFQMALRRDWSHPIAKMCYDKIGSWNFAHDTEKILKHKFSLAYAEFSKEIISHEKQKALTHEAGK